MDGFYDVNQAGAWLDGYITQRVQSSSGDDYLSTLRVQEVQVAVHQEPRCWRMTRVADQGAFEVEVKIPGIICSKTLPPQQRPLSAKSEQHVRKLRQFVKLTGLRSDMFEGMSVNLSTVHSLFQKAVFPATLQPMEFKVWDGDYAIDTHTRYFTDRRHAPSLRHEPLADDVDPMRYLDLVRGANFIHCADNRVEYCERLAGDDGERYVRIQPAVFQVGDIVEASVSFVAYPAGKDEYVLVLSLRALTMVNSSFREEANSRREQHILNIGVTTTGEHRNKRGRNTVELQGTAPLLKRRQLAHDGIAL